MLILYLSYYITTVRKRNRQYSIQLQSFNKNSSHPILGLVRFPSVCSTFSMENDAQYWCFSNRYVFMDFFYRELKPCGHKYKYYTSKKKLVKSLRSCYHLLQFNDFFFVYSLLQSTARHWFYVRSTWYSGCQWSKASFDRLPKSQIYQGD